MLRPRGLLLSCAVAVLLLLRRLRLTNAPGRTLNEFKGARWSSTPRARRLLLRPTEAAATARCEPARHIALC